MAVAVLGHGCFPRSMNKEQTRTEGSRVFSHPGLFWALFNILSLALMCSGNLFVIYPCHQYCCAGQENCGNPVGSVSIWCCNQGLEISYGSSGRLYSMH